MNRHAALCCALVGSLAIGFSIPASAQAPNIDKLKQMKVSGTDLNIPPVLQTGPNATAIRENLKRVKLPPGFKIDLYAIVPDARHMAVAPSTNMLFVGTRKTTVWAVTDRNSDGVADEVKAFAPSLKFSVPNGVCWTRDGFLIVVDHNRVLNFPAAEFFYEGPDVAVIEVVPQGKLIPVEEESYNHGARTCRVGKDGMLYITLGQPFNVQPREKLKIFDEFGIGGIVRMNAFDGSKREVYARGIRNSVGFDWHPETRQLWFTDNGRDMLGDDAPPDELNTAPKAGLHFGYPYCHGGDLPDPDFGGKRACSEFVGPEKKLNAHVAALGMRFYTGSMFPLEYKNAVFIAEHGSWNRSKKSGYRLMVAKVEGGKVVDHKVFADGFLDVGADSAWGRPVDVLQMPDGSLLVSDDHANAIYRITYSAK